MNSNASDDDNHLPRNSEVLESPRKRMRLDNSARKSWSLMDRKTDYEVLQEMGVSLLEPDDGESNYESNSTSGTIPHHKPSAKRKRDIENVNPNIKSVPSPRAKGSPRSPRAKVCSPGPSKGRSPRSNEKQKPHHPTDQQLLETSILEEYLIDEETPLAQSVSAQYMPTGPEFSSSSSEGKKCGRVTPLSQEEELLLAGRSGTEAGGEDSSSALSDEMMLSVFRWLPKRTLAHCMLVCKRWYRVACDETLWQRLDLGNKTLNKDALGRILARKTIIVRLASSEIGEWHPASLSTPSRIQYLDLSMATVDQVTLDSLLTVCPLLKKLSLESLQLQDSTCRLIGKCSNLEALNLSMTQGITEDGLTHILTGCTSLVSLNISWCNLSEPALQILVTMLPTRLQRLNVSGARIMTDDMVSVLCVRCPRLLELDLSDCSRLTALALQAVNSLHRLDHLALSRCYLLPAHTLTKLSSMVSLQYLEVWGMLQSQSLNALRSALPSIQINQFRFSAIARPTVGTRRTSIWGLRTRD